MTLFISAHLVESTLVLAVRTRAGDGYVMTVQKKTEGLLKVFAQEVEMGGGNLDGRAALVAREMTVDRTGQVVHRGVLIQMGVHDDLECLELLEDSIDGRGTDVGLALLHFVRDLVGREMAVRGDEDLRDRALRDRGPAVRSANRRDNLIDVALKFNH
jgi:hypothetical protein